MRVYEEWSADQGDFDDSASTCNSCQSLAPFEAAPLTSLVGSNQEHPQQEQEDPARSAEDLI
jgi:hypothetical protein